MAGTQPHGLYPDGGGGQRSGLADRNIDMKKGRLLPSFFLWGDVVGVLCPVDADAEYPFCRAAGDDLRRCALRCYAAVFQQYHLPAAGQRIIDGRPFASVSDLLRIKGIGEKTLEALWDLVCVEGE